MPASLFLLFSRQQRLLHDYEHYEARVWKKEWSCFANEGASQPELALNPHRRSRKRMMDMGASGDGRPNDLAVDVELQSIYF